jgi:hypothetical protein
MEYFYQSQNYILVAFIVAAIIFRVQNKKIDKNFVMIALLFFMVESFQYIQFGGFNLRTFAGTYIRLFLAYAVVLIAGKNFPKYFVRVMYFFSVISLFFYAFSFLPGAENFYINVLGELIPNLWAETDGFYRSKPNIVVFCFEPTLFTDGRNSGPFWEPGGFAVFLVIALLFNHMEDRSWRSKRNIIFVLCLLTTFSTAGYLAFAFYIIFRNVERLRSNIFYLFILVGLLVIFYNFYERVPFLQEKIKVNIQSAESNTTSRFGSALADLQAFKKNPFFGLGRAGAKEGFISDTQFSVDNHRNNGIFDLLSTYGLIITIVYFSLIYRTFSFFRSIAGLSQYFPLAAFAIILTLGFSQGLFLKPFFYSFLFLPFMLRRIKVLHS